MQWAKERGQKEKKKKRKTLKTIDCATNTPNKYGD
jgi:hypothetical protein